VKFTDPPFNKTGRIEGKEILLLDVELFIGG
jgi:hypothetical protein